MSKQVQEDWGRVEFVEEQAAWPVLLAQNGTERGFSDATPSFLRTTTISAHMTGAQISERWTDVEIT